MIQAYAARLRRGTKKTSEARALKFQRFRGLVDAFESEQIDQRVGSRVVALLDHSAREIGRRVMPSGRRAAVTFRTAHDIIRAYHDLTAHQTRVGVGLGEEREENQKFDRARGRNDRFRAIGEERSALARTLREHGDVSG